MRAHARSAAAAVAAVPYTPAAICNRSPRASARQARHTRLPSHAVRRPPLTSLKPRVTRAVARCCTPGPPSVKAICRCRCRTPQRLVGECRHTVSGARACTRVCVSTWSRACTRPCPAWSPRRRMRTRCVRDLPRVSRAPRRAAESLPLPFIPLPPLPRPLALSVRLSAVRIVLSFSLVPNLTFFCGSSARQIRSRRTRRVVRGRRQMGFPHRPFGSAHRRCLTDGQRA